MVFLKIVLKALLRFRMYPRLGSAGLQDLIRRYSWCQFHQRLTQSFYLHRSQNHKDTVKLSVYLALL